MAGDRSDIEINGRRYAWPDRPLVVVCVDGSEPAYTDEAIRAGQMPFLGAALERGAAFTADCVVPSFTNPNNLSIVTGAPPSVHGISGNFFYDPETDAEVMMNDPALLRSGTILAAFANAGARVAVVTAKDKLRAMLGHGMPLGEGGGVCFSAEKADDATVAGHGIADVLDFVDLPLPSVYSAALSEFVFAAGVKLLSTMRPDITYLSTTDYVQHKHAPGTVEANAFYAMIDGYLSDLDAAGAVIALTADHGMNAKHGPDGQANVIYLQDVLDDWLGPERARVILPITDPYVVHHGALGSFATAYLGDGVDIDALVARISALDGVDAVFDRETGCAAFELPRDRVGDLIVVSARDMTLGTSVDRHDLSGLDAPLRSHGGTSEQRVPLLFTYPVTLDAAARRLRNYDIFDIALNHVTS